MCAHAHTHTREHYSALKKEKETWRCVIRWMNPEGMMLSEISQ